MIVDFMQDLGASALSYSLLCGRGTLECCVCRKKFGELGTRGKVGFYGLSELHGQGVGICMQVISHECFVVCALLLLLVACGTVKTSRNGFYIISHDLWA